MLGSASRTGRWPITRGPPRGVITVAPSLALAESGASALPRVLEFSGTEPILRFVDVAVDHELSGFLVLVPVVSVHRFFVGEELTQVVWHSSLGGTDQSNNESKFHICYYSPC